MFVRALPKSLAALRGCIAALRVAYRNDKTITQAVRGLDMARAPYVERFGKHGLSDKSEQAPSGVLHHSKMLPFEAAAAAKVRRVQDSFVAARKGNGLFGLKK